MEHTDTERLKYLLQFISVEPMTLIFSNSINKEFAEVVVDGNQLEIALANCRALVGSDIYSIIDQALDLEQYYKNDQEREGYKPITNRQIWQQSR